MYLLTYCCRQHHPAVHTLLVIGTSKMACWLGGLGTLMVLHLLVKLLGSSSPEQRYELYIMSDSAFYLLYGS